MMATNQEIARRSLKGHLLIASPHADGSPYRRSAVLLLEDSEQGAAGVVLDESLRSSLEQLRAQMPRFNGPNRGPFATTAEVPVRVAVWKAGQLDGELERGLWLYTIADPELLFGDQVPQWSHLVREVGRAVYREAMGISGFPADPSLN